MDEIVSKVKLEYLGLTDDYENATVTQVWYKGEYIGQVLNIASKSEQDIIFEISILLDEYNKI